MKLPLKQVTAASAIASAGLLVLAGVCGAVGLRINDSKSIPLGIYVISNQPAVKGAYVLLCPPQSAVIAEARRRGYLAPGFCPGDYGYLMKMIFAVQGGRRHDHGERRQRQRRRAAVQPTAPAGCRRPAARALSASRIQSA